MYEPVSLSAAACVFVSCNAHQAHTHTRGHVVPSSSGRPSHCCLASPPHPTRLAMLPAAAAAAAGHVVLCFALLRFAFIKNAMQSTLQVNNSRAELHTRTHTGTHSHVLVYCYKCVMARARNAPASTQVRAAICYTFVACEIFRPSSQAQHETNNFYYASHCTNE